MEREEPLPPCKISEFEKEQPVLDSEKEQQTLECEKEEQTLDSEKELQTLDWEEEDPSVLVHDLETNVTEFDVMQQNIFLFEIFFTQLREYFSFCGPIHKIVFSEDGDLKHAEVFFESVNSCRTAVLLSNGMIRESIVTVEMGRCPKENENSSATAKLSELLASSTIAFSSFDGLFFLNAQSKPQIREKPHFREFGSHKLQTSWVEDFNCISWR